jgi:hypothetical protein
MTEIQNESERDQNQRVWIVAISILGGAIILYRAFLSSEIASNLPFFAGKSFAYSLVFWPLFHLVFLRKRGPKRSILCLTVIFAAMFVGGLIGQDRQKRELLSAFSEFHQEANRMAQESVDPSGIPKTIPRRATSTSSLTGDASEVDRFMKDYADQVAGWWNEYVLDLNAIGWNSLLDGQRIKHDKGLSESKLIINRAKSIVAKYEQKTSTLIKDTREGIKSLNVSMELRRAVLAGFEEGVLNLERNISEHWALEKDAVQQCENIITLLERSNGWEIVDGQLLFEMERDLNSFNHFLEKMEQIAAKQDHLAKERTAMIDRSYDAAKSAATK